MEDYVIVYCKVGMGIVGTSKAWGWKIPTEGKTLNKQQIEQLETCLWQEAWENFESYSESYEYYNEVEEHNPDSSEEELLELYKEAVENVLDYGWEPYNEDKHAPSITYTSGVDISVYKL